MWPYLVASVSVLSGALLALWWRYKVAVLQGQIAGLTKDAETLRREKQLLGEQLDAAVRREVRSEEEHQATLSRRDKELEIHRATEDHLRELLKKYSSTNPELLVERLGLLFPAKKADPTTSANDSRSNPAVPR